MKLAHMCYGLKTVNINKNSPVGGGILTEIEIHLYLNRNWN